MQLSFKTATTADYRDLGQQLRETAAAQPTQEDACQAMAEMLYTAFHPEIVLARIYRLTPAEWLPAALQDRLGEGDDTALTLLGTYGVEEGWRSRHDSQNHQVMSMNRIAVDQDIPMMVETLRQLGLDLDKLYKTNDLIEASVSGEGIGKPVYVPDVKGSPFIPDQEPFVEPYDVQSLVGFGGFFRDFDDELSLYFSVIFTNVPIAAEEAERVNTLQAWVGTGIAPTREQNFLNDG